MHPLRKILVFVVLSIIGIIVFAIARPERINSEFETKHFWTYKTHNQNKYDYVFYGDSRLYRGLSPNEVLKGTDYTGYNFGYSSGGMTQEAFEFIESHLDSKTRPTFVFGITPHSFTVEALKNHHFHQEMYRNWYDKFQRYYIDAYLKPFDRITPEEMFGFRSWVTTEWCSDDGWMMSNNESIDTLGGLKHYKKVFDENPIDTSAMNNYFVQVKAWTDKGYEVYAYRPPTFKQMEELEENLSGFVEEEFVKRFEKAGGTWMYVSKNVYQTYDGSHLKSDEVLKLSQEINYLLGIQ